MKKYDNLKRAFTLTKSAAHTNRLPILESFSWLLPPWGATAQQWLPTIENNSQLLPPCGVAGIFSPTGRKEFQCEEMSIRNSKRGFDNSDIVNIEKTSPCFSMFHKLNLKNIPLSRRGRAAFTLAETLITLLVIGVVAALTIPALMQQLNGYTLQKQQDVFSKKWQEGLRQMRVDGKLESAYTTDEFVSEMQKYFKIATVCKPDNLTNCFAEKITSYENNKAEEFEVKDLKSAKNFNKSEEDSPVYGLRFTDGTNMLISYKKDCKGISEGDTRGNHAQCILYVYDVNANKSPNSYGGNTGYEAKDGDNDMSDDKRNQINKGRDIIGNASITKGNPYGLSFEILNNRIYNKSDIACVNNSSAGYSCDYWLASKQYCEKNGAKLPSPDDLDEIAEKLYENANCTISTKNGRKYYINCNANKLNEQLGTFINNVGFWTSKEGYFRAFYGSSSDYNNDSNWRRYSWDQGVTICIK